MNIEELIEELTRIRANHAGNITVQIVAKDYQGMEQYLAIDSLRYQSELQRVLLRPEIVQYE